MASDDESEPRRRRGAKRRVEELFEAMMPVSLSCSTLFLLMFAEAEEQDLRGARRGPPMRASFQNLPWSNCVEKTRFHEDDLPRLLRALRLPDQLWTMRRTQRGFRFSSEEGLLILLTRMAWPHRQRSEMETMFNRKQPEISEIFNRMLWAVDSRWAARLEGVDAHAAELIRPDRVREFGEAVAARLQLPHRLPGFFAAIVGFIDGTSLPIAKPGGRDRIQRSLYNGHDGEHVLKCQGVVWPDGLCFMYGPCQGTSHDMTLLAGSDLNDRLHPVWEPLRQAGERWPFIYGDVAYQDREHIMRPFHGAYLNDDQLYFNDVMKGGRVSVEHYFGVMKKLWKILEMDSTQMRLALSPIQPLIRCAALLTNCHNCLYPNQISQAFGVAPPELEEYLM